MKKRRSYSVGNIAFKEFNLMTELRGRMKDDLRRYANSERDSVENSKFKFKARKMPDFNVNFIPLLNEKPLTLPSEFQLEVDKRAS